MTTKPTPWPAPVEAVETIAPPTPVKADVVIVGAGSVGLSLGMALAQAGVTVVLVGSVDLRPTGRTVALLEGSIGFLARLGLWSQLSVDAEPLKTMRIVDDTASLFRGPPVEFKAAEIGRTQFGANIENHRLVAALADAAVLTPGLTLLPGRLEHFTFGRSGILARGPNDVTVAGSLLIASDGRRSAARQAAGLSAETWHYPQTALTTTLQHDRPHRNVSTEFHTRQGPFTLVPLPGRPEAPHRSSLVWVMAPAEAERRIAMTPERLARDIERQSRMLLGRIDVVGVVGQFPMGGLKARSLVGQRIALAGEAAHAMPPIGAQGLNLSLRDAATLADVLGAAKRRGEDLGAAQVLDRYAAARRGDIAIRGFGVDLLNRALLADRLPVDFLRGAGLLAIGSLAPLRRFAMRQGLMPSATHDDSSG